MACNCRHNRPLKYDKPKDHSKDSVKPNQEKVEKKDEK